MEQIELWGLFSGSWNEHGGESTHALFNRHQHMTNHCIQDALSSPRRAWPAGRVRRASKGILHTRLTNTVTTRKIS